MKAHIENNLKENGEYKSKTSKLWLLYIEMVVLLQTAIKAERTGDFKLHLSAVSKMLSIFAASGHRLYTKSARLYLQQMMSLTKTHPDVYRDFMTGHDVIPSSDRFWQDCRVT